MQWRALCYFIAFSVQSIYSQSYIIKFSSVGTDTGAVFTSIRSVYNKNNIQNRSSERISFRPLRSSSLRSNSAFPWNRYSIVQFTQKPSEEILRRVSSLPSVEYIQQNNIYRTYSVPNDSAYSSQWNLRRIGISELLASGIIRSSMPVVKVGVIDTGIDDDHPDLRNVIAFNSGERGSGKDSNGIDDDGNGFIDDWRGYDFVEGSSQDDGDWSDRDNDPNDENGHGTAVSGIIGAQTSNGIGLAGIAPVEILPLRAFGKNGTGNDIDIASAIIYAADNGAEVINMSFGDVVQSTFLHDAIKYAYSKNAVLSASSGNDGSDYPHYPSDFTEVISTGSVGRANVRSFFSAYSPSLDVMAPGEEIVTTVMGGGYTEQFAGTSAAAPHTAGVAALIKSIQKQKKIDDPSFIILSNEEIRGVLLNSADDAGETGWDKFNASGIINASRALSTIAGVNVQIHSPGLDEHISGSFVPVIVSAVSPYFQDAELYYGTGDSPTSWTKISTVPQIMIRDTMIVWNISSLIPNIYQLRLLVKNSKGNDVESRLRFVIDQSVPAILAFRYRDSVIIGTDYGGLVEARIDRNSTGVLYYRKKGETAYRTMTSGGIQLNHSFILTSRDFAPKSEYEFYCLFSENSTSKRSIRFPNVSLVGFDHFLFTVDDQRIQTTGLIIKSFELPGGFLLNAVPTIQNKKHVILNEYTESNDFGRLKSFQFSSNNFVLRDSSIRFWVPRSFLGASLTDNPSILVQDRGISQLLSVDTLFGNFFSHTVWGDSTDVWASQLTDLDGDAKPEIIARSSSEFLIYKKIGNGQFTVVSRLPNPTRPLSEEARNQFGPPRSIIGDFTASGRKEILFADYDGDMILYRQTAANALSFDLASVDSTELLEMSDYIASGDFNGDGIQDIVVAGHNDLGWNQDREYNVPVWTVRVFSHRSNDAPGTLVKIWEQNFLGVRSGSGYDNGIVAGKFRPSDSQDALFISFNPQLYVFVWDPVKKDFISKWTTPSQSNSVIIDDLDGDSYNDFGFHVNGKTQFWSLQNTSAVPVPFALSVIPLSAVKVKLSWNSNLSDHRIYRGTHADSLTFISAVNGIDWIDSTVKAGVKYFYSVAGFTVIEGVPSEKISVIPHAPPFITSVVQSSMDQLTVGISFDVASSDIGSIFFVADSSIKTAQSNSVAWRSARTLLVTFAHPFVQGTHSLRIRQLIDGSGMYADTVSTFSFNASLTEEKVFFARSVSLPAPRRILIEFNDAIGGSSSRDPSNFSVRTIARQFPITSIDSVSSTTIGLNFAEGNSLAQLKLRVEVSLSKNIVSSSGVPLNSGKGQVLSIAQESRNLENVTVYPNPVKNSNTVSFANLPSNCRITIFVPSGNKVKVFEELSGREGISWDLRDEKGNIVSTGIYLYRLEQLGQSNSILNTTLGKFAVIR